jgi:hypothetical protein
LHGLGLVRAAVAPQRPDLLGEGLDLGPQRVALGDDVALAGIEVAGLPQLVGGIVTSTSQGGVHRVELGTEAPDVDHGRKR